MGGGELTARLLGAGELEAYSKLASEHGCIFDTVKWTGLLEPGLLRFGIYDSGDNLRGGFCLFEQRRFGLKVLRNPPFTPQSGPFFEKRATNPAAKVNEQRGIVEVMAEQLARSGAAVTSLGLSLAVSDCLPFYWRGYKVTPHYTYRLHLHHTAEEILAGMSPERRKNIAKAQRDGLEATEVEGTFELRELICETFNRQSKAFPRQTMDKILASFPPGSNSFAYLTKQGGKPVAGIYVIHDSRTAYYLLGGYAYEAHHGAGALAMWRAILKARELGLEVFDFEGSTIPPIERYFRGFGGVLTPVFNVHKAWLPIEMALKLRGRYRNRF